MNGPGNSAANSSLVRVRSERRILVVDDDLDALRAISDILNHLGHVPVVSRSAEDALMQLEGGSFGILLIDYRMPEVTGLDLITVLREEGCKIPIIMMTGYAATDERVSRELLGIATILKKPILASQLADAIEACQVSGNPARKSPG